MTGPDPFSVIITGREIYDAVIRTGQKVDLLSAQVETKFAEFVLDTKDHELRIRALEKAKWPLPSVAILVSIASVIAAYFIR